MIDVGLDVSWEGEKADEYLISVRVEESRCKFGYMVEVVAERLRNGPSLPRHP